MASLGETARQIERSIRAQINVAFGQSLASGIPSAGYLLRLRPRVEDHWRRGELGDWIDRFRQQWEQRVQNLETHVINTRKEEE
jgi:hypothetical protein